MNLGSSFAVPAGPGRVFRTFLDPEAMRSCVPGCTELARTDETHYQGRLVNEIAHVRFSAAFSAEITEMREPEQVRAVLKGEDRKLGSSIKIDALLTVRPDGDASTVTYGFDIALWGKIGRLGEAIVRRRSAEVERQFVEAFTRICAGEPVAVVAGDAPAPAPAGTGRATAPAGKDDAPPRRPSRWRRLLAFLRRRRSA
ncbi:hypothetical protein HCC61_20335 [Streptomyces sp. HNM0575]|uniref:CoxG family protein n=1 Tax=Streptomyces sp. HNM0575 TaxID=2716338 RepID=UPI00145D0E69|nr:SRPBCC domain-containing protein [Streptomyces sp. HNM0575]NLU74997.1 hypothetical protein [Streptomyces sp. HNM0575]